MSGDGDLALKIDSVALTAPDILVLELVRQDGAALQAWHPGAHIDLVLPSGIVRQYSLCGDPADLTRYRIAVLREAAGRGGSEELHVCARAGSVIQARGPRNHFALVDAPRYLFVAGGIGITPILPMIAAAEAADRPWSLIYGGRSRAGMGFLSELAMRQGGEVTVLPQDETGHPDLITLFSALAPDTVVYGCGPAGMLKALEEAAATHGLSESLHIERFSAAEDVPAAGAAINQPFEVELRRSGLVLQVPANVSFGTVLQDADIPVSFSCQEGYCGSCETVVLEGVPDHRDTILNADERAANAIMMVCVGRSRTPRLVLDL